MKKIMITAAGAVFALGLATAPASAGWKEKCAAGIKEAEEKISFANPNWMPLGDTKGLITDAKKAIEAGDKKGCFKAMKKAKAKANNVK